MKEVRSYLEKAKNILYKNIRVFNNYRIVVPHLEAYPVPYCWDTGFHVLALTHLDEKLAIENIKALLSLIEENGMIPNAPLESENQDLRSQPPIIIYAAKYYMEQTKDVKSIKSIYPKLKKYYTWWRKFGNPNNFIKNLVSPFTGARENNSRIGYWAVCSTGMDNHPIYDFSNGIVKKINGYYYLKIYDLLLSSTLAAGANSLSIIAEELNFKDDEKFFKKEFEGISNAINNYMWSDEEKIYYPISWNGDKIYVKSAQILSPLYANIVENEDAKKLISHIVSPKEFWGKYGIPTIAFDDTKYMSKQPDWMYSPDPYYWRGPIWPPMLMMAAIGFLNYSRKDLIKEIASKWLDLMIKDRTFSEYYYNNGKPGITNRPNFGWSAAATIFLSIKAEIFPKSLLN